MKTVAIIPARYASKRFPGKPLAKLQGKPLLQHVYEKVKKCDKIAEIFVGTDDQRIFQTVKNFGGKAVMTAKDHQSGTDRIAEVCEKSSFCQDADLILNVQGDEPFISEKPLEKLIASFHDPAVQIATLMNKMKKDQTDPNRVKVVFDSHKFALYFSRSQIPFPRENTARSFYFQHIGVYGFRRQTLLSLVKLPLGILEETEKLEQLRFLENGYRIKMVETDYQGFGIDTAEDLVRAEKIKYRRY